MERMKIVSHVFNDNFFSIFRSQNEEIDKGFRVLANDRSFFKMSQQNKH